MVGKLSYFLFEEGMISEKGSTGFCLFRIQKIMDWKTGTLGPEDQASHRRGLGGLWVVWGPMFEVQILRENGSRDGHRLAPMTTTSTLVSIRILSEKNGIMGSKHRGSSIRLTHHGSGMGSDIGFICYIYIYIFPDSHFSKEISPQKTTATIAANSHSLEKQKLPTTSISQATCCNPPTLLQCTGSKSPQKCGKKHIAVGRWTWSWVKMRVSSWTNLKMIKHSPSPPLLYCC